MAATLKRASANITTSRTLVVTAAPGLQTIVVGGTIANTDATETYHAVTVEVQKSDSTYVTLVKSSPIAVGGSLLFPKTVLEAGDKIYMTADANGFLVTHLSYVEKS